MLADGDGEADIHPAADGDHGVGIEAAVGAHRELPAGPSVAHPPHRFTQEVGGAAGGVGAALAQPGHQHVAGAGGDGQQRVIAPLAGIAVVACALLGQSVGLADGGIEVNGQRPVAGSRPGCPGPGQQLAAHPVQLTDVAPTEAAQEGAQGGWRLDRAAQGAGRPPGAQHIGVVDAVAPSQRGGHQASSSCRPCSPAPGHRPSRGAAGRVRAGRDAGPGWREGAARHWPPGGGRRRRYGCGRGGCVVASIGCSLFWGRFAVSKPLSQIQRSTPLPLQDANATPSFGGFRLRYLPRQSVPPERQSSNPSVRIIRDTMPLPHGPVGQPVGRLGPVLTSHCTIETRPAPPGPQASPPERSCFQGQRLCPEAMFGTPRRSAHKALGCCRK